MAYGMRMVNAIRMADGMRMAGGMKSGAIMGRNKELVMEL